MGHAEQHRGDALRDLRRREWIAVQTVLRVVVNVDEAGREHQALGVDDCVTPSRLESADRSDPVFGDPNVRATQRRAGAIRYLRVDDDGACERDEQCMHGAAVCHGLAKVCAPLRRISCQGLAARCEEEREHE
jgi:hypothetical protein